MTRVQVQVTGISLSHTACGGAQDTVPTSLLRVDLDKFVAALAVKPIDGITAAGQPDEAAFGVFA